MSSFSQQLKKFGVTTMDRYSKVRRASALDLFSSIVMDTVVDKGVLKGNWFAQIGSPSYEQSEASDPSGGSTLAQIEQVVSRVDIEETIYLTNNLPYAVPIEYDHPDGGMVRINTIRWENIVINNARKFQNG